MRGKHLISTALTTVFFLGPLGIQVAAAQQEYVPKVNVQTLHQGELPGMDGKEMTVKHLAIPPGYIGGKHMHTGPVFVYVLEGELTLIPSKWDPIASLLPMREYQGARLWWAIFLGREITLEGTLDPEAYWPHIDTISGSRWPGTMGGPKLA